MYINLGCGDWKIPAPWINVDSQPSVKPDVVATATGLPFADETAESVYCGHVLEHLTYDAEVPAALAEIRRVLKPGGRLCVVGPDAYRAACDPEWMPLLPIIITGGGRWAGDDHRWISTGPVAVAAVRSVFSDAAEVDIADTADWPVRDRVGWQCAVIASKEAR